MSEVTIQTIHGTFTGTLTTLPWLNGNQIAMRTNIKDFPVRVIDKSNILGNIPKVPSAIKKITVAGSKGNVYTVSIKSGKGIHCTCPAFTFRHNCKHLGVTA